MRHKKPLGKILAKKKSWNRVVGYLSKYLKKYGSWEYTYEFNDGTVHIKITAHSDSVKTKKEMKAERKGRIANGDIDSKPRKARRKMFSRKRKKRKSLL